MPKHKHIHKYRRMTQGSRGHRIYKCQVPGCTHYIDVKLAEGRISLCNRCNEPFVIDKRSMKQAKPHCNDCVERTNDTKKIEDRLKAMGM